MLPVNTVLQGRYQIVEQIGRGGMGAVYKATDTRLRCAVALKETLVAGEALLKAFEREAQLLAGLRHPTLPKVSDHFIEGTGQFLVMEFIPGDDLGTLLGQRGSPFPTTEVLRWADQLLDALDYLHTRRPAVIHRDIKPQNMKLTDRGEIILLDFGLAKGAVAQTRLTSTGSIFGYTPHYAPLEQIQGTGTDPRSDLYSLAATLHHLLTGLPPTDALTRAAAKINEDPDPLIPADRLNAAVPPAVAALLTQAMAQKPDHRPPSAAAMRVALRDASRAPGAPVDSSGMVTIPSPPVVIVANPPEVTAARPVTISPATVAPVTAAMGTTLNAPPAGPPAAPPATGSLASKKPWRWLAIIGALALVISLAFIFLNERNSDSPPASTSAPAVGLAETATEVPATAPPVIDATAIRQTVQAELTAAVASQTAQTLQREADLATARVLVNATDSAGTQTAVALTPTATALATEAPPAPSETPARAATARPAAPTKAPATSRPANTPRPTAPPAQPTPTPPPPPTPEGPSGEVLGIGGGGDLFRGAAREGTIPAEQGEGGSCIQGRVTAADGGLFASFYVQVDNRSDTRPAKHFFETGNYKICGLGAGEWGVAVYAVNNVPTSSREQSGHQVRVRLSGQAGEIFFVDFRGKQGFAAPTPVPEPTAVPPTSTPAPGPYDGQWAGSISGTTAGDVSFNGRFRMEVRANAIYSISVDGPSCLIETYPNWDRGAPIGGNSFAVSGSPFNPRLGTDGSITFSVNGTFTSGSSASGNLNASQNGNSCAVASWSASKQ